MSLSKKCILEISELSHKAETLAQGGASERRQAEILTQRIAVLRQVGLSTDECREHYVEALTEQTTLESRGRKNDAAHRAAFDSYLAGKIDDDEMQKIERRDFLSGTQSLTSTQGAAGGFFVPFLYDNILREAMAQVDPILDENVCDFSMTPTESLQPEQVSGYDLSTISAQLVGETVQQAVQTVPPVAGGILRADKTFRVSFAASLEAETDIPNFPQKITRSAAVALARKIGQSALVGRGGTDIAGITSQLSSTVSNGTGGKLTLTDFNNIYFAVDRWYRASKKCAWLMSDGVYKLARAAVDSQNRPLLSIERDTETIFGKPVYVSPSLANLYSSIGTVGCCLFGDLSHVIIRASRPRIARATQLAGISDVGGILRGECLYRGMARCDALLFNPGSNAPVVLATVN